MIGSCDPRGTAKSESAPTAEKGTDRTSARVREGLSPTCQVCNVKGKGTG